VDKLPLSANGKILRRELREREIRRLADQASVPAS
jgi:acyl-CoA synthetase (AMP-forming)/AMP-acid ligase II